MEIFAARLLVSLFDPIGVLLPLMVLYSLFRRDRFGWLKVAVGVMLWRSGLSALLSDPFINWPHIGVLAMTGAFAGAAWSGLFNLIRHLSRKTSRGA